MTLSASPLEPRVFESPDSQGAFISTVAKETEDAAHKIMSLSALGQGGCLQAVGTSVRGRSHQLSPAMPLSCWAAFLELS